MRIICEAHGGGILLGSARWPCWRTFCRLCFVDGGDGGDGDAESACEAPRAGQTLRPLDQMHGPCVASNGGPHFRKRRDGILALRVDDRDLHPMQRRVAPTFNED